MADDLFDVSGRHVYVTGASSGLGRHFATMLAQRGARVSFGARRADRIDELTRELREADHQVHPAVYDVTKRATFFAALDAAEDSLGPVDALVNNAGISVPKPVLDLTYEDWHSVVSVNLDSVWIAAQEVARRAVDRDRSCSIVNIASIAGIRTYANVTPYVATNAAVIKLTKNMAIELARKKVRVNAIAPGRFDTELGGSYRKQDPVRRQAQIDSVPMGRVGDYGELDGALILLISNASSYMTGSVIVVDGGNSENSL